MTREPGEARFPVAVRGYDRDQVDEHLARVGVRLADAQARAERAEREVAELRSGGTGPPAVVDADPGADGDTSRTVRALGEQVALVLETAWEAAEELRRQAVDELAELRERAATEARSQVDQALATSRQAAEELAAEVADLTRRRDAALAELDRLRGALEGALRPRAERGPDPTVEITQGPDPAPRRVL